MYIGNFWFYNVDSEKYGDDESQRGDYWKFVSASSKEIDEINIYYPDVEKIIVQICNPILKQKMKEKLFNLIKQNGIFYNGGEYCFATGLFNNNEIKEIIDNDNFNLEIEKIAKSDRIKYKINDISSFINLFKAVDDLQWEYSKIKNIIDNIKDNNDKTCLVYLIENLKENKNIYFNLIKDYFNYLPDEYKKFLQVNNDNNYLYNKSLEFENQNLHIGIDSKINIGPEIETNNDYNFEFNISQQKSFEEYVVKTEATVPNGMEIACHPFHDNPLELSKFCALCYTMTEMGYYYDENSYNAAGQINLGLDYLDSSQAILNFYEIFCNCEELLFYISNEEGQLFRQNVYINSRIKAISEIIGKRIVKEDISRNEVIKLFNLHLRDDDDKMIKGLMYKKNTVCLRGNSESDYRFEIRIPNGGCNYKTWIDNIRLYGKIMEISKKLADATKKEYLTEEEEKLLKLKIDLQNDNLSLEEKLIILMNLLFKDDNIKKIYYNRYISVINKIRETGTNKYQDSYQRLEPAFKEVDFEEQYTSRFNPDYDGDGIIYFDPDTNLYMENGFKKRI